MAIASKLSPNPKLIFDIQFTNPQTVTTGVYSLDSSGLGRYALDFTNKFEIQAGTKVQATPTEGFNYGTPIFQQEVEKAIQRLQEKYNKLNLNYIVTANDVSLRALTPVSKTDGTGISLEFYFYNVNDNCENTDFQLAISGELVYPGDTYKVTPSCFTPKEDKREEKDEFEEVFTEELRFDENKLPDGSTKIDVYQRKALKNKRTGEITPIIPPKFELVKTFIIPPNTPPEKDFYVYKRFAQNEIIQDEFISKTYGVWGDNGELLNFYTSSNQQEFEKQYVLQVVSASCDINDMFSIYYGDYNGGGTLNISGSRRGKTYSKMIYSKYRNLCLEDDDKFILNDGFNWADTPNQDTLDFDGELFKVNSVYYSKDNKFTQKFPTRKVNRIFAIKVPRALYGDKLDEGNIELNFARLNPSTGIPLDENYAFTLIDSSLNKNNITSSAFTEGISYDLISGSILTGKYTGNIDIAYTSYGKFYPNMGLFILDADKLNSILTLGIESGSNTQGNNPRRLFSSISGSATETVSRTNGLGLKLRKVDNQLITYYHINIRPKDFNYSNNPTFVEDDITTVTVNDKSLTGYKIKNIEFLTNPTSYITTVGLYDDNYQLLAVGKLSKVIKKTDVDKKSFVVRLNTNQV